MKQAITGLLLSLFLPNMLIAAVWQIGPSKTFTYCSQVAPLVHDGDTVRIDAATYTNDIQVHWTKNNLLIQGVGGRPRLVAGSIIAGDLVNGKGIFVISGADARVENIEFANAVVVDHNGAGIRQEGRNLVVSYCKFDGNEMGILCGNISNCKTTIEYSEFVNGGSAANPGYQHNVYINHIDTLVFRYNYSHEAIAEGHELKSRASNNFILYNRIANEQSTDSRSIDLPNGGTAVVVGNIIEQGINSANSNLVGYGLEGLTNPGPHNVWMSSNTMINKKSTGSFIQIAGGTDTLFLKNNLLAGVKTGGLLIGSASTLDSSNNLVHDSINSFGFVNPAVYNYHLKSTSIAIDAGINITKTIKGYPLKPDLMYKDTCQLEIRINTSIPDIGAFEYLNPLDIPGQQKESVYIYPNPAHERLYIQLNGERLLAARCYTLEGRFISEYHTNSISTPGLSPGIYLLAIETDKSRSIHRLTIQ